MPPLDQKVKRKLGFTLIELSIAMVVIALLVGATLVGLDLIKASERQRIIAEWQEIETAVITYRIKYSALAGDHNDAYQFFAGKHGCTFNNNPNSHNVSGCNGSGNNRVDSFGSVRDHRYFFDHLYYAGFLKNIAKDTAGQGGSCQNMWICPMTSDYDNNNYYQLLYQTLNLYGTPTTYKHFLTLRTRNSSNVITLDSGSGRGVLYASDVYAIDQKVDDGRAFSGTVIGRQHDNSGTHCVSSDTTQQYRTEETSRECEIHRIMPF